MAIQYSMTVADRIPSEAYINDNDSTSPTITPPAGTGWVLINVSVGANKYILTWQKGGGTVSVTTNYAVTAGDEVIIADATSGPLSITLPVPHQDTQITVKKADSSANAVTVLPYATETIDAQSTYVISTAMMSITLVSNGTNWFVV